jgi:acyl-CoA synthetase (AMP-forming)/AMP-acid ligase II
VIGVPHESLGEEAAAVVTLKEGAGASPDELRCVAERVAAYKHPRRVWLVEELPKGPTGMVLQARDRRIRQRAGVERRLTARCRRGSRQPQPKVDPQPPQRPPTGAAPEP